MSSKDANGCHLIGQSHQGCGSGVKRNDAGVITDVACAMSSRSPCGCKTRLRVGTLPGVAGNLSVVFLRSLQMPSRGFMGQFEILSNRNRASTPGTAR